MPAAWPRMGQKQLGSARCAPIDQITVTFHPWRSVGRQARRRRKESAMRIEQALNNEEITIYGDGRQQRCFTYIDDAIRAIRLYVTAVADAISEGQANAAGEVRPNEFVEVDEPAAPPVAEAPPPVVETAPVAADPEPVPEAAAAATPSPDRACRTRRPARHRGGSPPSSCRRGLCQEHP